MEHEARPADEPPGNKLHLPSRLDLAAAETLCQSLRERLLAGEPVIVAAGMVERVSTPGIQVLLAAAVAAQARPPGHDK